MKKARKTKGENKSMKTVITTKPLTNSAATHSALISMIRAGSYIDSKKIVEARQKGGEKNEKC